MQSGRTEQILERLIDSVENGQSVPLAAGKVMVNKDETILLLRELASIVQTELRVYREVTDKKGKIITEAKKEAEDIIYEAEQTASRIRVTKRMSGIGSGFRAEGLSGEDKQALRTAHDIYAASLIYTDEMLTEVNDIVAQAYDLVANQYGRMIETLQEKATIIAQNKAELMSNLKELSREERYTQILELGQLLSYELYNEKMKARQMEEYGSYQMEMLFEEQATQNSQQNQVAQQTQYSQPVNQQVEQQTQYSQPVNQQVEQQTQYSQPVNQQMEQQVQYSQPVNQQVAKQSQVKAHQSVQQVQGQQQAAYDEAATTRDAKNITYTPYSENHIEPSDPKPSLEAVSKTLAMFKNYKPGTKPEEEIKEEPEATFYDEGRIIGTSANETVVSSNSTDNTNNIENI